MSFAMPQYQHPDFTQAPFAAAPDARLAPAPADFVAPEGFHVTSIYPEYFKLGGQWKLLPDTRMDCVVVAGQDGTLRSVEARHLKKGEQVVVGRSEDGGEGIFLHAKCFARPDEKKDSFAFRTSRTRETSFSADYDNLYRLLQHEREHGHILWVAGPAFSFDADARRAMQALVDHGFVDGLLSGNALATHDLEASVFGTALGVDIYSQKPAPNGHYNHLDVLNGVHAAGSIEAFVEQRGLEEGIMCGLVKNKVPYVLTGSIRDDGPLPGVFWDVYEGQDAMRAQVQQATTIICMATQLHSIATGNLTPVYRVVDGEIRPLYIYNVDISEFVLNKLRDRGSLTAISLITNAQDFIVQVARGVGATPAGGTKAPR
ncbi:hypothetical protein LJC64_02140 [Ruminococcaceae bacterium OttesenSCG-928-A11]|nr:hypothetical protein [Ruminococcaceae bacterium OttesenSCG-928-A11]